MDRAGVEPLYPHAEHSRPPTDVSPSLYFHPNNIKILNSPTALLNDTCLNSCVILLQELYQSNDACRCAILSTHDLVLIRYNTNDDDLWRNIKRTTYWLKDIWILPIHHTYPAEHWVLAVLHLHTHQLHLFDSFANQKGWKRDVKVRIFTSNFKSPFIDLLKDIGCLMNRMVLLANKHGEMLHLSTEG